MVQQNREFTNCVSITPRVAQNLNIALKKNGNGNIEVSLKTFYVCMKWTSSVSIDGYITKVSWLMESCDQLDSTKYCALLLDVEITSLQRISEKTSILIRTFESFGLCTSHR